MNERQYWAKMEKLESRRLYMNTVNYTALAILLAFWAFDIIPHDIRPLLSVVFVWIMVIAIMNVKKIKKQKRMLMNEYNKY